MAEEKMQAAKVLLKNPYRQVILQDYNKTLESHKFRKKAEEIETIYDTLKMAGIDVIECIYV